MDAPCIGRRGGGARLQKIRPGARLRLVSHPSTLPEILDALDSNSRRAAELFATVPEALLFDGDSEHWSPAHHLVHLTAVAKAVARELSSDSLPLHATGSSRPYAEVRDAVAASLVATPKETLVQMGRRVEIAVTDRRELVESFESASRALRSAAGVWSEDELDRRAMRHVLAGVLSVREMLMFMVFHERHHMKIVRRRVESEARDA